MVDALISIALEKLTGYVGQQLSLFAHAPRELEKLSSTLKSIQAGLADAERRQVGDENVKLWLSRLRHVAYDIEDLVEDWRISGHGDEEGNEDDGICRKKPRLSLSLAYSLWDRYQVARNIEEIRERLDQIDVEGKRYGFSSSIQGGNDRRAVGSRPPTTSLMDESEMFIGRENDKETIIGKLVRASSHEDRGWVQIVAVAGIGGLGKTTLARQIYNDCRVQNHFNTVLYWVCVSDVFDEIRLTKAILEQVEEKSTSLLELDALQRKLLEALQGKRFLIVLDDVWNDDAEKWKMLQLPLNSGAQGSRILVTTRVQKVANTMNAAYIHELQGLSDDDSWKVFTSRAFAGRKADECSKLENVGRQIVSKCGGVPLAITVMGSAMSSKRNIADWQSILDSKMWLLRDAENKILPALWLSYYNLPSQLKRCFAYCSMFPKDWVLKKDVLVRLWVAQGFIRSDGNRHIEDIGADYFDDLVAWSMIQKVEKNYGGEKTYTMHDLLHDLAASIAMDEIYTFIGNSEQCPIASSNVRHSFLYFTNSIDDKFNKVSIALDRATKLRTLFLDSLCSVDILHKARFVRALAFLASESETSAAVKLPNAIGDLKHLRYLDLSGSDIVELPESVSDLRYLHTLNLCNCCYLKNLPRGIGGMVSLRHLEIARTESLECLPKGLGKISGLRSLCKFIVGGKGGCGIDELQPLNSLQGTLKIRYLERVGSREEAEKAELWNKQYLSSLVLDMSDGRDDDAETATTVDAETATIDSVLEGLRPHENLEELYVVRFTGSKLPRWMDGMQCLRELGLVSGPNLERVPHLPSLKKLKIDRVRIEILPDEGWGQLVALQELTINLCKELKCLPEGLTQLSSLEKLDIDRCYKLESLPEGLGQLKKLKELKVDNSKVLRCLPDSMGQLESLETLNISSCKKLESLPVSLGQLKKLKSLWVTGSEVLTCLPDSMGQLESLETLNISSCKKLESLPVSLGQLKKLKSLEVSGSEVLTCLPDSVGQLESLETLNISSCKKLESLPVSLGQLKKLKSLEVNGSEVLTCLPDSVGQLKSLKSLDISSCKKLESLPVSLGQLKKLKSLEVSSSEVLTCLPDSVGQLESLKNLDINSCKKLESLPISLGQLKKLKSLKVSGSEVLTCLPDSVGQLESLQRLDVRSCEKLESLPVSLGQLKKLRLLSLKVLTCLPDSVGQLESLEWLDISSYKKLESLPISLGQLKKLKSLWVIDLETLTCLPDSVGQLESLQELYISSCKKLESLPVSLGQLKKLKWLSVIGSEVLTCLPDSVGQLESLKSLNIWSCKKLESLPDSLGQLKKLNSLEVGGSEVLTRLPDSVGQLESLQKLDIISCEELESLPVSLGQLKKLNSLKVSGSEVLTRLPDSVGQLESLESLDICSCKKLESLPASLGQHKKLKSLSVGDSEVLTRLPVWVGQLESLESLAIYNLEKLESLPQGLRHLSSLFICGCPLLWERYKREGGVDWPNISHIPNIYVDAERIQ